MAASRAARRTAPLVWYPVAALRRHPLVWFFLLAYGFSWLVVLVLGVALRLPAAPVIALNTLGPTVAALVMTALLDGRPGLRHLRDRLVGWRVGLRWYLLALVGIPLAYLLATLALPGMVASFQPVAPPRWFVTYVVVLTAGAVVGGPLLEEPGWRGFALPRLQARLGPMGGTLLLGVLWGLWHLPQYLVPAWAGQNGGARPASIGVFLLTVLAIAVLLSWLFNCTRGSLLLAVVAHASVNAAQAALINPLFPRAASTEVNALLGFGAVAVVLLLATRGRLGYAGACTPPDQG